MGILSRMSFHLLIEKWKEIWPLIPCWGSYMIMESNFLLRSIRDFVEKSGLNTLRAFPSRRCSELCRHLSPWTSQPTENKLTCKRPCSTSLNKSVVSTSTCHLSHRNSRKRPNAQLVFRKSWTISVRRQPRALPKRTSTFTIKTTITNWDSTRRPFSTLTSASTITQTSWWVPSTMITSLLNTTCIWMKGIRQNTTITSLGKGIRSIIPLLKLQRESFEEVTKVYLLHIT